jgi:hypothetical protein
MFASLQAEETASDADVERGRAIVSDFRDETIRSELHMSESEAAGFWPIYSEYRKENIEIMDRYSGMITDYIRRYEDAEFSDEYADQLIETYFGIKRELLAVQEKFLPRFREVLPALQVARFYQLENKMNVEIDSQLALAVPLIEPG